jgi:exodeoxyribonuclease VII small subunit
MSDPEATLLDSTNPRAPTAVADGATVPFERALDELETIVAQMEDGTLSLEQSLAAYRRGAELVKACETALERAKEQVRVLDGELLRPLSEVAGRAERGG